MKEVARRLMKTNWVQDRLKEEDLREILEDWTIDSLRRGLKPEGKPSWDDLVNRVKRGQKIALSDYIDMFLGFDFISGISGLENLRGLKDKPILLVANHINNGPLKGGWQHVLISRSVKETTQKEIRLLHGFDPTTTQDLFRERLFNSINSIPVRDPDPNRALSLLRQAIRQKDSMLLYPEGDGSKNLRRAMPESGRLIEICARNGMEIVSCSAAFQSDTFFLIFDTLDRNQIQGLMHERPDRNIVWQNIADYSMRKIAESLPQNRRGHYRETQIRKEPPPL